MQLQLLLKAYPRGKNPSPSPILVVYNVPILRPRVQQVEPKGNWWVAYGAQMAQMLSLNTTGCARVTTAMS
ncbi:hypothetical protein E2320_003331 [Naja naja]|nr:hypothetical protein E2320_003331 [Naja naja]